MEAEGTPGAVADARPGNWVDRHAPAWARAFLRLGRFDRPIGAWLLMWPCWWSAGLAALADGASMPDPFHLALFLVGAFAMRAAGCVYNDIVDRDIDARVERTRSRPLPSGQVTVEAARRFMLALALVGLVVVLQLNAFSIALGIASLAIVAVYPFMKRLMGYPQLVLGLAFGWGALMGWAARFGEIGSPAIALYAGTIAWIVGYDTIYAHQDKEDDALIGLGSTALRFGERTRAWLAGLYGLAWAGFAAAGLLAGAGPVYLVGLALAAVQMGWQVATLRTDEPANCHMRFRSNHALGAIVFLAIVADLAWRAALPQ